MAASASPVLHDDERALLQARIAELELQLATAIGGSAEPLPAQRQPSVHDLAWSNTPLERLFSVLPDLIYVVEHEEMRISFCNDRFARGIGFADRAAVQGRTIYECFSSEDAAYFVAQNRRVFQHGETLYLEERIELPDGPHYFDTYKVPLTDADGHVLALLGTSHDITELVLARQLIEQLNSDLELRVSARTAELEQLNHELERAIAQRQAIEELRDRDAWLLSQVRDAIIVTDSDERIVYWNEGAARLFGWPAEQMIGTNAFGRESSIDEAHRDELDQISRVEEFIGEVYTYTAFGRCWVETRVRPLFNQAGRQTGRIALAYDTTERRKLNEQLIQAQKMEGIGRLAGGVAHDFNNLLVVIAGGVELARAMIPALHPAHSEIDAIQQAGERAAHLTHQLLTFARRQVGEPQLIDLSALLRAIESMLRRLLREDIRLSLILTDDLWPIAADQGQIEQVVVNLVVNAQDAMPDGGLLEIFTENSPASQLADGARPAVTLMVRDSGVGMSDEILSHVFEPFFTTKPLGKGTGLGLATCYGIVTQHGGMIRISSQPMEGTQVLASFPRASGSVPAQASAPPSTPLPSGSEQVLLVEDEPAVRQLIARVLRGQGYKVYESENGREALTVVEEGLLAQIDLLLTDLVMPVMGGRELAQRLATRLPTLKILFVSGYAADERLSLDSFYAAAFLAKPFSPAALAQKVRALLDG